jgi:hypothetical protein
MDLNKMANEALMEIQESGNGKGSINQIPTGNC